MPITPQHAMEVLESADCCYTQAQVQLTIDHMAQELIRDYKDKNPLFLCVMNGGLIFTAELLLRLPFPPRSCRRSLQGSGLRLMFDQKPF